MSSPPLVLIVDDDRSIQRLLADALSKQGFSVAVERDGEWAVRTFEKKPFDLVLLDLLLPGLNGYEVARKMLASPRGRRTPIVFISGVYKSPLHQKEAVEKHGAFAFLEKPLRVSTLYDVARRALGERYPDGSGVVEPVEQREVRADRLADQQAEEEVRQVESSAKSVAKFQAIRGEIKDRPFPEVLAEVHRWKGTGALLLNRGKVKKIVYFREGVAQSVKSNLLSECLGRVMVKERMISEAECEESLKRMQTQKRQQGTVLMEMGCINPHNLSYALGLQLQQKLYDVFGWEEGEFQFNPRVLPPPDPVQLEMTTAQVIYEGVRRAFDAPRMKRVFGDAGPLYVHLSENPLYALQDAGLGEEELSLLHAADGSKTVEALRGLDLLPPLDTDRFFYAMKCAQMVELRKEPLRRHADRVSLGAPPLPSSARHTAAPPPLPPSQRRTEPELSRDPVVARAAGTLLPELSVGPSLHGQDESLVREKLAAKVAALRKQDLFQALGVPERASREEIKQAFFALAREYHPDKHFASASAETRKLAGQIYDTITRAHDTLTDPMEKERYLQELKSGSARPAGGEDVQRILAAEAKFQKGEEALRAGALPKAHQLFQEAVNLYAEEGEFHAYLGWTHFQLQPSNMQVADQALRVLEKAVSLNPRSDKGYLFQGYVYKATGRPDKAEKQFERAIQCNPDCLEALRELRILGTVKR